MTQQQEQRQISSSILVPDALIHLGFHQEIQRVETQTNNTICQWLDRYSGIDYITRDSYNNIGGIASRIRFVSPAHSEPYQEFTIRCDKYSGITSEYDKRIDSIKNGFMFPTYTMQSWYSGSCFICGASMLTKDLYQFMSDYDYLVESNYSDRAFKCVKWKDIQRTGFNITIKDCGSL